MPRPKSRTRHRVVRQSFDVDNALPKTHHVLVDAVVDDLLEQDVDAVVRRRAIALLADVHPGAEPHVLVPLEGLDGGFGVLSGHRRGLGTLKIISGKLSNLARSAGVSNGTGASSMLRPTIATPVGRDPSPSPSSPPPHRHWQRAEHCQNPARGLRDRPRADRHAGLGLVGPLVDSNHGRTIKPTHQ